MGLEERGSVVDEIEEQEGAMRDQLWASLRALRPEIDHLAEHDFDNSDRQRQLIALLASIVRSELDFRARTAAAG